jgi:hypothetical protein
MGILLAKHSPFSPNINSIKYIWFHFKKYVQLLHSELTNMDSGEEGIRALEQALIEAWKAILD